MTTVKRREALCPLCRMVVNRRSEERTRERMRRHLRDEHLLSRESVDIAMRGVRTRGVRVEYP